MLVGPRLQHFVLQPQTKGPHFFQIQIFFCSKLSGCYSADISVLVIYLNNYVFLQLCSSSALILLLQSVTIMDDPTKSSDGHASIEVTQFKVESKMS